MNNDEKRFNNILGEEYELLKMAIPHYDDLQSHIAAVVGSHKGSSSWEMRVLELGPGSGITTKALLRCSPRTWITAIDNEDKMVVQLKANVASWNVGSRVHIVQEDIVSFLAAAPDQSFDVVASAYLLHNLENGLRERVIKDIYRVLKPGGVFVNGDKYAHDDLTERARVYSEQIQCFDVYDSIGRSDYKDGWIEHYVRDERPDVLFIEGPAKEYMRKLGFVEVTTVYREMMEAVVVGKKPE